MSSKQQELEHKEANIHNWIQFAMRIEQDRALRAMQKEESDGTAKGSTSRKKAKMSTAVTKQETKE